jgi:hypothetical protein
LVVFGVVAVAADEARTSRFQSAWLSKLARGLSFELGPGASPAVRFPESGPFDRLGYDRIPEWTKRLQAEGFDISAQARMSPRMLDLVERGLFASFDEKTQAGLELQGCRGEMLYASRHPQRVYAGYGQVPPLVVDMLVFIENRELFAPEATLNPALDWQRLGHAAFDQTVRRIISSHEAGGGSTLATQIEKYVTAQSPDAIARRAGRVRPRPPRPDGPQQLHDGRATTGQQRAAQPGHARGRAPGRIGWPVAPARGR